MMSRNLLHIVLFFDKLISSEGMEFCYACQAFRRDFHYFKLLRKGGLKCRLLDIKSARMEFTVTVRYSVTCIVDFRKMRLTKPNVCFILVTEQMF